MRRAFLVLASFLLMTVGAFTQIMNFQNGVISTGGSDCSVATNCVIMQLPAAAAGAAIHIDGTFTGTILFEGTNQPLPGSTWHSITGTPLSPGVGSNGATGAGIWQMNVAGLTYLRLRASAMSGAALITMSAGTGNAISSQSILIDSGGSDATSPTAHAIKTIGVNASGTSISSSVYGLGIGAEVFKGVVTAGVTDTSDITVMPASTLLYNWPTSVQIVNTDSTGTYGWVCNGTCATAGNRQVYFYAPPGASYVNTVPFQATVGTAVCVAVAAGKTTIYASARGWLVAY